MRDFVSYILGEEDSPSPSSSVWSAVSGSGSGHAHSQKADTAAVEAMVATFSRPPSMRAVSMPIPMPMPMPMPVSMGSGYYTAADVNAEVARAGL